MFMDNTAVRIPKSLKEAAIAAHKQSHGYAPVFEEWVQTVIRKEIERDLQEAAQKKKVALPRTGSD